MMADGEVMKTIKQIAEEIGVSKQAVYKRVKGSLHTVVAPYVHTVDGVVYISEQGKNVIVQAFLKKTAYKGAHTKVYTDTHTEHMDTDTKLHTKHRGSHTNNVDNSEIAFLREQNKALFEKLTAKDKQLEDERTHSREQSDKLATLAAQLAELNRNNQLLLSREQSRTNPTLLTDSEPPNQPPNKPIMRPPNEPTIQPHTKPPKQKEKQPQPTQKRFLDIFKKR